MKRKGIDGKSLKEMLLLLALTVLFVAVYQTAMRFYLYFTVHIYTVAASVLIVVFFIMNGGFSKELPDRSRLPAEWSEKQKDDCLEGLKKRKEKARKLLFVIFPLLVSLLVECIFVFFA